MNNANTPLAANTERAGGQHTRPSSLTLAIAVLAVLAISSTVGATNNQILTCNQSDVAWIGAKDPHRADLKHVRSLRRKLAKTAQVLLTTQPESKHDTFWINNTLKPLCLQNRSTGRQCIAIRDEIYIPIRLLNLPPPSYTCLFV